MSHQLKSKRLKFRAFERSDAERLAFLLNDIEISRGIGPMPHPYTIQMAHEYLDEISADLRTFALEYDDALAGAIGFNSMLGFWLAPTLWGQGIITEAATVMIGDHFGRGCKDLASAFHDKNVASARVHEKLGFRPNGSSQVYSKALARDFLRYDLILSSTDWEARA
mgnify:CR=1 FL=1